jgi:hypothetical protein
MAGKEELLGFLDKHVFQPILQKSERELGIREREDLKDLKQRTLDEMGRFHGYNSAEQIVEIYKNEITQESARPVNARLQDFGLPRLVDVKDEFLRLAGEGS